MSKHAYLIMAHNEFDVLRKLLAALDYEENDIYIHVDVKAGPIDQSSFRTCCKKSGLYFVPRMSVVWGGESQIACEVALLQAAISKEYAYYHLISGVDFPIKTQKELHAFFDAHSGEEFIEYFDRPKSMFEYRIRYTYPLQERIGRYTNDLPTLMYRFLSKCWVGLQVLQHKDRIRDYGHEIKFGSQWISITHAFAEYLLEHLAEIRKYFFQGVAADELFVQTLCWNSSFKEHINVEYKTRLIDWDRGSPYTWQEEDLDEIMKSPCFFVRKVTGNNRLVDRIQEQLLE